MSKTKIEPDVKTRVIDEARDKHGRIHCAGWPLGTCGRVVEAGGFEIDHVVPEIASTPEMRSDPGNLQVLCAPKGKANQHEGCHRKKTREEARARAAAARRERRGGGLGLRRALGLIGLLMVAYAVVVVTFGPAAGSRFANWCLGTAVACLIITLAVNVYIGITHARPPEPDPTAPKPSTAGAGGLDPARIKEAFQEVAGAKGAVKVAVADTDGFEIHYPGTGFQDSPNEDGRAKLIDRINSKLEPDRWRPHWETGRDRVTFTRRPALPPVVPHPGFPHPDYPSRPWNIIPIAPGASFNLLKTSHVLIIGATNAGKTSLIRAIVAAVADSATRDEAELLLFDPKRIELLGFRRGWSGVRSVVTDTWTQWVTMAELRAEMEERYTLLETKGVPLSTHRRLIVVVDEFEDLVESWTEMWQGEKNPDTDEKLKIPGQRYPQPLNDTKAMLRKARRCGIHLIIGTQSPDATFFGGTGARANLEGRAAVGPIGPEQAKMAFGDTSVGRDLPHGAKGRATVQVLNGEPEEVQTYWVPDPFDSDGDNTPDDWAILARLGFQRENSP